jgi:hypothetical protein
MSDKDTHARATSRVSHLDSRREARVVGMETARALEHVLQEQQVPVPLAQPPGQSFAAPTRTRKHATLMHTHTHTSKHTGTYTGKHHTDQARRTGARAGWA